MVCRPWSYGEAALGRLGGGVHIMIINNILLYRFQLASWSFVFCYVCCNIYIEVRLYRDGGGGC